MAKSKVRPDEVLPGAASPYAASRRAYLLSVYYATGKEGISFATVQASHCNETHRFAELSDAFDYLLHLIKPEGRADREPGP